MATKGGGSPTPGASSSFDTNKKDLMLVAAIDFGTTFSGYAFSFKHEYQADPYKVSINPNLVAGTRPFISLKTPTIILFDERKKFHSFGYEAEDAYSELAMDDEHHKYYFFKRFKMELYNKKINRQLEIGDAKGRKMFAIDVFGAAIKYFKDNLLNLLKTRGTEVECGDINWVLTIPTIWNDSAKQFMRESAYKAGIGGAQLTIALEPVVASLFCQLVPKGQIKGPEGARVAVASPGTKYMVIDLGGGRADITVYQRQDDGVLKELHKASGGAWGGTKVDEEFFSMIIKIIGAPVFKTFVDENIADHLDLQRELETKKRSITPKTSGKVEIKIPYELIFTFNRKTGETVWEAIEGTTYAGKIWWRPFKMRINAEVFQNFFKPCTDKIVEHIKGLLQDPNVQGTNIFLMVGGFSESEMIQDAIMKALPRAEIIIPAEPGLAVLKGAVIFGHRRPSLISNYTYGTRISPPFDPTIHPESHRVSVGGIDICRDVFKKYISKGDIVKLGEAKFDAHDTPKSNQREMSFELYVCPRRDPMFVDEHDIQYLGKLVVNIPESAERIHILVKMIFVETGLAFKAVEMCHGKIYSLFCDYDMFIFENSRPYDSTFLQDDDYIGS